MSTRTVFQSNLHSQKTSLSLRLVEESYGQTRRINLYTNMAENMGTANQKISSSGITISYITAGMFQMLVYRGLKELHGVRRSSALHAQC